MPETWYVLENGNVADPSECAPAENGALVHASGVKVAMRAADCPMSRSVDPDAERAKAETTKESAKKPVLDPDSNEPSDKAKPTETRDLAAEKPKRGYQTRESKAD